MTPEQPEMGKPDYGQVLREPQVLIGVLHDIQAQLHAVLADSSEVLRELDKTTPDRERLRHDAKRVLAGIELLVATTDNARVLQVMDDAEDFDLGGLVRHGVQVLEELGASRGVRVDYRNELPRPTVMHGSARQLRLVVYNLLLNAIKYSTRRPGDQSKVTVSLRKEGPRVALIIANVGPPIPPDEVEAIFQPSYRGRSAVARAPGSGLGLFVAREVVRRHQGELEIRSEATGSTGHIVTTTAYLPGSLFLGSTDAERP